LAGLHAVDAREVDRLERNHAKEQQQEQHRKGGRQPGQRQRPRHKETLGRRRVDWMTFRYSLPPKLDLDAEKHPHVLMAEPAAASLLFSAHDLSDGGFAVALAECCFGSETAGLGVAIKLPADALSDHVWLFSESPSRMIVEAGDAAALRALAEKHGVPCADIGRVVGGRIAVVRAARRPAPAFRPARCQQRQEGIERQLPLDLLLLELPEREGPRRLRHVLASIERRPRREGRTAEDRRDGRRRPDDLRPLELLLHPRRSLRAVALRAGEARGAQGQGQANFEELGV
jgi:hypothetical protein